MNDSDDSVFGNKNYRVSVYEVYYRKTIYEAYYQKTICDKLISGDKLKKQLNDWCVLNTTDSWSFYLFSYPKYGISYIFSSESDAVNFKLTHLNILRNEVHDEV